MNTCPNCGVSNDRDTSVCICGHLRESEELHRGWETMKDVPGGSPKWNLRRVLPLSIWVIVGGVVLGLAFTDPGLRARIFGGDHTPDRKVADTQKTSDRSHTKITAKVVSVVDGESFTAVDSWNNEIQVRLAGVDAPKPGDYFSEQARANLAAMIGDAPVSIDELTWDDQGLVLARVIADGKNINLEQIRGGYAWISGNATEFLTSGELENFRESEVAARSSKVGLWTQWDTVINSDTIAASSTADLTQLSTSEGVFTSGSENRAAPATSRIDAARTGFAGVPKVAVTPAANPFDPAQAAGNHAFANGHAEKDDSDCKPEVTAAALKQPEIQPPPIEARPLVKNTEMGKNYILGPRGGCFYVTASGGKKYVDHGMCSQPTAAAGRQ